jgi:hypothetical protein
MSCNTCTEWTPLNGCDHEKPTILTYKLNTGITVLGKMHNGKIIPCTYVNNLQAETNQVLTAATGIACSVYQSPVSRTRYVRIDNPVK